MFWVSILNTFIKLQHFLIRVTHIDYLEKKIVISSGHTLSFCSNLVKYRSKNMFPKESLTRSSKSSSLQTKEDQGISEFNLVGLEHCQRLRRQSFAQ